MPLTKQKFSPFSQEKIGEISSKPFYSAISSNAKTYIRCKKCGCIINLRKAKISGYDSENSLRHIHCSRCGQIVKWSPGDRSVASIIQGICGIILGGALAYLLYPHLKFYGLQAGFFTSLYGLLKALIF